MNKILLSVLFGALTCICFAQDTVISQTEIGNNWYSGSTAGGGQSFTIENEGKLTAFRFYTHQPEGSTVVQLREGQDVNGNLLFTDTVDVSSSGWFTVNFPQVTVCPGIYCVLLYDFQWGASNLNNPYPGGMAIFGGGWTNIMDMAFEVVQLIENDPPVPNQAVLADHVSACPVNAADLTMPSATDFCSQVTVTNNAVFPITADTTIITWTYTDGNGGITTQPQRIIRVADTTAPVIFPLYPLYSACAVDTILPEMVTDCSGPVAVSSDAVFPITADTTVVTWTFTDAAGNSASAEQLVIILPVNANVITSGNILTAMYEGSDAEVQWLDCANNYSVLSGETNDIFEFTGISGSFAVAVTSYGCVDTSACLSLDFASVNELSGGDFKAYPNPVSSSLTVEAAGTINFAVLTDLQGRVIWNKAVENTVLNADLSELKAGSYILSVSTENEKVFSRKIEKL